MPLVIHDPQMESFLRELAARRRLSPEALLREFLFGDAVPAKDGHAETSDHGPAIRRAMADFRSRFPIRVGAKAPPKSFYDALFEDADL